MNPVINLLSLRTVLAGTCPVLFLAIVVECLSLQPIRRSLAVKNGVTAIAVQKARILLMRGGCIGTNQDDSDVGVSNASAATTGSGGNGKNLAAMLSATAISDTFFSLGSLYSKALDSNPILTKSVTAMVLFAISDQLAQGLEIRRKRKSSPEPAAKAKGVLATTNKTRSLYSGMVGLLYFGPMAHYWYAWIFRNFPGKSMLSILQKAALGQFFFAPPLFCVFFAAALIQQKQFTITNWIQKIKQDLLKGWLGGISFWPFVNYIAYGYVPPKWIPLFVNVMGLIFNIYVSIIANLKQQQATKKQN